MEANGLNKELVRNHVRELAFNGKHTKSVRILLENINKNLKNEQFTFNLNDKKRPNQIVELFNLTLNYFERSKHPIKRHISDEIYVFNQSHWVSIQLMDIVEISIEIAILCGLDASQVRYHKYIEDLNKQFGVSLRPDPDFHKKREKINFVNGTLDLNNYPKFETEFNPDDCFFYCLPYPYNPNAKCEKFDRFLNEVLSDTESQKVLFEFFAYPFIELKLEKMLVLYGKGGNGKSVLFDIQREVLGKENVATLSLSAVLDEKSRYQLEGKLINYGSEIGEKIGLDTFKRVVSQEPIEVKKLYKDVYMMEKVCPLVFNANHIPFQKISEQSILRRLIVLNFENSIPKERQNPELAKQIIQEELPGIMNRIIEGYKRLRQQKAFTNCKKSTDFLNKLKNESDNVIVFLEEYGYEACSDTGKGQYLLLKDMYNSYSSFCYSGNFQALNKTQFKVRLIELGFLDMEKRFNDGYRVYYQQTNLTKK